MADTLISPMHVEIMSPDGAVYTADGVEMVVARAIDGEFAVMKGHLPLVAALTIAPVRVKKDGKEKQIAVFNGFLEINDDHVNIVSPQVELAEDIDVARAQAAKKRAEERLASKSADIDTDRAQLALNRALLRLRVTKSL